jgi:hypothetical protein
MFDPAQAYAADRLWQAAPLRQLVRSKVRLAGGGVSPDGRISLGAAVRASVEPRLPGRGACGAEPACAEARRCTPSASPGSRPPSTVAFPQGCSRNAPKPC